MMNEPPVVEAARLVRIARHALLNNDIDRAAAALTSAAVVMEGVRVRTPAPTRASARQVADHDRVLRGGPVPVGGVMRWPGARSNRAAVAAKEAEARAVAREMRAAKAARK